jgi:hypothetical protein
MKAEIYKDEGYFGHKGTLEWKRFILSELMAQTPQNANPSL